MPHPYIAAATYNMSWASDKGLDAALKTGAKISEQGFLLTNPNPQNPRYFWLNALDLVIKFISAEFAKGNYPLIGLQELTDTSNDKTLNTGTNAITKKLETTKLSNNFEFVFDNLGKTKGISVGIIFDKKKFGNVKHKYIFDLEKGRPALLVHTINSKNENYILCCVHFPHHNFDNYIKKLEEQITEFEKLYNIITYKLFILGDFNDDTLDRKITFGNKNLSYFGPAPHSCCFPNSNSINMTTKSHLQNKYSRPGDKTFGEIPSSDPKNKIKIYPGFYGLNGQSIESDHQMVYQYYNGGKIKSKRKTKNKSKKIKSKKIRSKKNKSKKNKK